MSVTSMSEGHQRSSTIPRGRRLGGPPPRYALGLDTLEHHYQSAIVRGATRAAEERGVSLVIFSTGIARDRLALSVDGAEAPTELFDLLQDAQFQGLILLTGTLTSSEPEELLERHLVQFGKKRLVSVGIETDNSHHVLVENQKGMFAAVKHLACVHQRRKIVFLRGPQTNREAEERYWAYRDALTAHDLPQDERLVVQCDFQRGSGTEAVNELIDRRGLLPDDFDALVAADDLMALEAIQELSRRKVSIPDQVAVFGFDDVEEARFCNPPLSSIRQPLDELGREAVRVLFAQEEELRSIRLPTAPQFRRSCGCAFENVSASLPPSTEAFPHDLEANLISRREVLLAEMTRSARAGFVAGARGWEVRIFNALQDEFRGQNGSFRRAFDQLLELSLLTESDTSRATDLISAIRRQLTPCAGDDPNAIRLVEGILHEARILTVDVLERAQAQQRIRHADWSQTLAEVNSRLVAAGSFSDLARIMQKELPRIGIPRAAIVQFQSGSAEAVVLAACSPDAVGDPDHPLEANRRTFLPSALMSADERVSLVVEPLVFRHRLQGYLVFEWTNQPGYVYAVLRQILTAVTFAFETR